MSRVADQGSDVGRELQLLESELKRLEAEYNMFFAGRLKRPPLETRGRVEAFVKRLDRTPITNYAERFRFTTVQSRFSAFVELWDRGLRAREEGRPGPFGPVTAAAPTPETRRGDDRVLHVTTVRDPLRELDKLHELYDRVVEARQADGKQAIPFHEFASLVKTQVSSLKEQGTTEVALRVAVRDGKLALAVRPVRPQGADPAKEK
jgi:hypothetical protein